MKPERLSKHILFIPSTSGLIKVHIYGFNKLGSSGQAFSELNGVSVRAKGYNRKKTIIRSLSKLHEALLNSR